MHEELKLAPGVPVTLRRDVGNYLVYYLEENKDRFPGVDVERVFVRRYPKETFAAHILGSVGEVTEEDLEEPRYKGLEAGDSIGQDGVEDTYDKYLRGKPGVTRIQVDAFGQPTAGGKLVSQRPVPGDNLAADDRRRRAERRANRRWPPAACAAPSSRWTSTPARSSAWARSRPTTRPCSRRRSRQSQVNVLYGDESPRRSPTARSPASIRRGSTFKIITALAALENGEVTPEEVINDPGQLVVGGQTFTNAGEAANGAVSLVRALEVSSDVYFYNSACGCGTRATCSSGRTSWGSAAIPHIDLPGAAKGLLPTQQWRNKLAAEGELEGRRWSAGDNVQLATGQGDLQTNPLQLALAYAALGNGGTVVTPHVGMEVDDSAGRVLQEFDPGPQRHVHIDPTYRAEILEGLHDAAQSGGGTSFDVFGGFPIEVAGKTGTAQRPPYADQSWYAVLAPYPEPEDRHRGDDGGRRLRRRSGGPGGAARSSKRISPSASGQRRRRRTKKTPKEGGRMSVATRSRRARPEPFSVRPGIAERLSLPYMDAALFLRGRGAGRAQRLRAQPDDPPRRPRRPRLLLGPANDLRCTRHRRHVPPRLASTIRDSGSYGSASTHSYA